MARKLIEHITDDIDGTPITDTDAGRTVTFTIDRATYEIDLTTVHVQELETALQPFIKAARTISRPQRGTKQPRRSKEALDKIRGWARANGHEISDHGRIPIAIADAYDQAH